MVDFRLLQVEAACKEASVPCGPIFSIKDSRDAICEGFIAGWTMMKEKHLTTRITIYIYKGFGDWQLVEDFFWKWERITTRSLEVEGFWSWNMGSPCQANRLQSNLPKNMQMENETNMSELVQDWNDAFSTSVIVFGGKGRVWSGDMFQDIVEDEHFKTRQCFEEVDLAGRKVKVPSIGSVSSDLGLAVIVPRNFT